MSPNQLTIFITGVCIAVAVYMVYKAGQWRRRRRASAGGPAPVPRQVPAKAISAGTVFDEVEEEFPFTDGGDYLFGRATPALAALLPSSREGRVFYTRVLRNAGYYSPHAWHNFSAVRYLCMILPILCAGVLLIVLPERMEPTLMVGLLVGPILGWSLPGLYVRSRATDRLREIGNGIPDMLDLLNMCVSQGMMVSTALGRIAREIRPVYPALAKELIIVTDQARIGSLTQALVNFSSRVDVAEVHSFSSLLTQTEQMGTSVSEALAGYSDNMRETQRQRADEKANAATFKLLFPTVLCLMPAVYLFLLGPAVIELNRFFTEGRDVLDTSQQLISVPRTPGADSTPGR